MAPFTSESLIRDVRSFYLIFELCTNKINKYLSIKSKQGYFKDHFNICKKSAWFSLAEHYQSLDKLQFSFNEKLQRMYLLFILL